MTTTKYCGKAHLFDGKSGIFGTKYSCEICSLATLVLNISNINPPGRGATFGDVMPEMEY